MACGSERPHEARTDEMEELHGSEEAYKEPTTPPSAEKDKLFMDL
jgi:hypothetical protein